MIGKTILHMARIQAKLGQVALADGKCDSFYAVCNYK